MKLRLPEVPQTQDKELHTELVKVYAAIRAVHAHAISSGPMLYGTAGETIAVGDLVGVKPDGKYYKAKDGLVLCIGFCSIAGDTIEVQTSGIYTALTGTPFTAGSVYYNSNVAGAPGLLATAPTWGQKIGLAVSTSQILFRPQF